MTTFPLWMRFLSRGPSHREQSLSKVLDDHRTAFARCYQRARAAEVKALFLTDLLAKRTAERDEALAKNAADWGMNVKVAMTAGKELGETTQTLDAACHAIRALLADGSWADDDLARREGESVLRIVDEQRARTGCVPAVGAEVAS